MGTFLVLMLFFALEVLTVLMWVTGTIGAAAITSILLFGTAEASFEHFWWLAITWGVLFLIPQVLLMVQSAVWCRGLTRTAKDLGIGVLPEDVKGSPEK